jgi:hypothetical protein
MLSSHSPTYLLAPQTAVDAIVEAEGNLHLAAERLHVSRGTLSATIARDPSAQRSLQEQLRAMTLMYAFDSLTAAKALLDEQMSELEPADFVKFYGELTKLIGGMTDPHESTTNLNITEVMLSALPPGVREAVVTMIQARQKSVEALPPPASAPGDAVIAGAKGDEESDEGRAA